MKYVREHAPRMLEQMKSYRATPGEIALTYGQQTVRAAEMPGEPVRSAPKPIDVVRVSQSARSPRAEAKVTYYETHQSPDSTPVKAAKTTRGDAPALKRAATTARKRPMVVWVSSPQATDNAVNTPQARAQTADAVPVRTAEGDVTRTQNTPSRHLPQDQHRSGAAPDIQHRLDERRTIAPAVVTRQDWPSLLEDQTAADASAALADEAQRHRTRLDHEQRGIPWSG